MPHLHPISARKILTILCKKFDFKIISQKGSHIKLRKKLGGEIITVIVPNHNELAPGTTHNILRQARIEPIEFLRNKRI